MCGLSGAAGLITSKEEKAVKDLLVFSQIRGTDSTGIASVSRNVFNGYRDCKIAKDVGPPYYLWDTKSFDRVFHGTNLCYIGHNRSRTVGTANRKNAHPFQFDHIIGAHNGTLDNVNKNRLDHGVDFQTDSEAIFNNIELHGIQDTIGRIEKLGAAYALTWYDGSDNSLNFLRNDDRPLWYVYANDRKTLFWASETEILLAALHRQNITLDEKAYIAVADTHLKWIIPDNEHVKLPEPLRFKYENKKVSYTGSGSFWKNDKGNSDRSRNTYDSHWNDPKYEYNYHTYQYELKDPVAAACSLPQDKNKYLDNITSGIQSLTESSTILREAKMTETKTMTAEDFTKKRKFEESKGVLLEKPPLKLPMIWRNSDVIVHRDVDTGQWCTLRWDAERTEWERRFSEIAPKELPYSILHISSHCFEHQGKKEKKRIYYKGFKKDLLTMESFNKIMQNGCLNCERKPEWGNEVAFLDHEHHFLCEHCIKTPRLIDDLRQQQKKVG